MPCLCSHGRGVRCEESLGVANSWRQVGQVHPPSLPVVLWLHPSQLAPWDNSQAQRPRGCFPCVSVPWVSAQSSQWMFKLCGSLSACTFSGNKERGKTMHTSCRLLPASWSRSNHARCIGRGLFAGERNTWVPFLEGRVAGLCLQGQAP